jgi:hypothetical protein
MQRIERITFDERTMTVALLDGRVITLPLEWYPPLLNARPEQRQNYRIETPGDCVHWPDIAEDLHVDGMLKRVAPTKPHPHPDPPPSRGRG